MTITSTPAGSATARDVIAQVIADGKSMFLNTKIEWPDLRKADAILAALAAAGYRIAAAAEPAEGEGSA